MVIQIEGGDSIAADTPNSQRLIAATLLRHALGFRDCPRSVIDEVVAAGHVLTVGKGELVVQRGDAFQKLCVVIEGRLEISVSQENGRRYLMAFLQPGDVAGMMSLCDGLPHPSDLIARGNSNALLMVPGDQFRALRRQYPALGEALELQMAYRTRLLHERLIVDSSMSLEMRLSRLLHVLSVLNGPRGSEGHITMNMSQTDIGDLVGLGRPRVNAAVQQLRKEGLIELHYSSLTIIDRAGLARRAGL